MIASLIAKYFVGADKANIVAGSNTRRKQGRKSREAAADCAAIRRDPFPTRSALYLLLTVFHPTLVHILKGGLQLQLPGLVIRVLARYRWATQYHRYHYMVWLLDCLLDPTLTA